MAPRSAASFELIYTPCVAAWARLRIFGYYDPCETFRARFELLNIRAVHQRWTFVRYVNSFSILCQVVYIVLGSLLAFARPQH